MSDFKIQCEQCGYIGISIKDVTDTHITIGCDRCSDKTADKKSQWGEIVRWTAELWDKKKQQLATFDVD